MKHIVKAFDLDYKGQGITKIDDKITFVKDLFDDETAEIKIVKSQKHFNEAIVEKRFNKSKDRVSDTYFDYAPLYGLSLDAECKWQQKITKETLMKIAKLDVPVSNTVTDGLKTHYRNKVTLHIRPINGRLRIGGFEESTQNLIVLSEHVLVLPILNEHIKTLSLLFEQNTFKDDRLKHITLRTNEKEVMAVLSVEKGHHEPGLIEQLLPLYASLYLNYKDKPYEILGRKSVLVKGKAYLNYDLNGTPLHIGPTSFLQVNKGVSVLMYDFVKNHLKGQNIIDAYAGMASISLYMDDSKNMIALESNDDAIEQAKMIIKQKQYKHIKLIHGDVNKHIINYIDSANSIIFDPPRSGLSNQTIDILLTHKVKQIIYISCDIKTLSRDLSRLKAVYDIESVTPFRMFPSTIHVETITLLFLKTA